MRTGKSKITVLLVLIIILVFGVYFFKIKPDFFLKKNIIAVEKPHEPVDWMFCQRSFPYGVIDHAQYIKAVEYRKKLIEMKQKKSIRTIFDRDWVFGGPTNIGGRITDIEMPIGNMQTIYAGIASGGIFKTTNTGTTWIPIFDDALTLSVGDLAIARTNENIIYVGTGEANGGGGSVAYDGLGVYKTTNGGNDWIHLGLTNIGSVGKVEVDPENPQRVYVAAMGKMFANNNERGVYRTINGGSSWEKVLYISDSTGAIDLAVNPVNTDTIYAAMWERTRRPNKISYGGITSGIYRSTNGGNSWGELTNGLPVSASQKGRIGISIAASSPNILYAMYATTAGGLQGVYKSTNFGDNWFILNTSAVYVPAYLWWFGKIYVDPTNANKVFITSLDAYKSEDGGSSWGIAFPEAHVDHHAFFVHPSDPNFVLNGNDGGVNLSYNGGNSSTKLNNLPITQFYTCEMDYNHPERLYGGAQDNSSLRTMTGNVNDWATIYYGDGFITMVDPTNNMYVYAEAQYGDFARSVNGGYVFTSATSGISSGDRKNWNTPVVIDPVNPAILYYGANRLYKSTNRAVSWVAISGDLSNGSGGGNLVYGTITTISVSPLNNSIIYAGTDDANIWVTQNGGTNWNKVSSTLPLRWVTRVAADPTDVGTAYATYSGYRFNSNTSYIYKTTNYGANWISVTGDLVEIPVNDIIINPDNHNLYIATDIGVFYSLNDGVNWNIIGLELPNLIISDIAFHRPTKTLVAGSYGRSMYKYDLNNIISVENIDKLDISFCAFPNPFSENLYIEINTSDDCNCNLILYNIKGELVAEVFKGYLRKGKNIIAYSANNLANGIYFCKINNEKVNLKDVKVLHIK